MKSTPRILVLYEGDPFAGSRGGDVYAQYLFTRLRQQAELFVVNRQTLGLRGAVTGVQYAERLKEFLGGTPWRSPVLQDGSSFYVMTETNRMLKQTGWGPIVSVLQEWLPAREPTFRLQLHLTRYLFRCTRTIDAHVAVSHWLKQRLRRLGVPGRDIDVARPGVAAACFQSAAAAVRPAASVLRVVTAGVYHPSKGQLLLVEALGELLKRTPDAARQFRVDMYGAMLADSTAYLQKLRERISELGLSNVVRMHQQLEQVQLWGVFGASDVFAFMAQGEGLPLVVLESMLHGNVPVVPRGSPAVELLGGGAMGVAVRSNPVALASALESLRQKLSAHPAWPSEIASAAASTTLQWPDAVDACARHITARMGIQ